METREHLGLKELASAWLLSMGCRAVAHEVPCPVARFRVDAAGWSEHDWRPGVDPAAHGSVFDAERAGAAVRAPRTVVVECKASRADFLRDDLRVDDLLAERGLDGAPVAFLKIDVEGYEAPALRGATRALARCRMALVEWSPEYMRRGGIEPAALADILFGAGFEVQLIGAGGSATRVTRDELLATAEQRDLLCLRA